MGLKRFTDQLNRVVEINFPPRRIISLVPSQTELLFSLGLEEEVVGLTKFCVHPAESVRSKAKVGGTKILKLELIRDLKPDLIIGNKEENDKQQVELLMQEFPVWMSDIDNFEDAIEMMRGVGEITNTGDAALSLIEKLQLQFEKLDNLPASGLKVLYLIWKDPYMIAGAGTFIDDMIKKAGWENAVSDSRYPIISEDGLRETKPDIILLSSEPYPFADKHIPEFQAICPLSYVKIVDGEMFSWYGSRLLHTPEYLYSLKQQFNTFKS